MTTTSRLQTPRPCGGTGLSGGIANYLSHLGSPSSIETFSARGLGALPAHPSSLKAAPSGGKSACSGRRANQVGRKTGCFSWRRRSEQGKGKQEEPKGGATERYRERAWVVCDLFKSSVGVASESVSPFSEAGSRSQSQELRSLRMSTAGEGHRSHHCPVSHDMCSIDQHTVKLGS